MDKFKAVKCPYCGSVDHIIKEDNNYRCSYCDCIFFDTTNEVQITLQEANNFLTLYKFDDADYLYRKLADEALENNDMQLYAMAEWGRLLSYFGVVYIKSFTGNVSIPTIVKYDNRLKSVEDSEFFRNIIESNASNAIKHEYHEMAANLDETYEKIGLELKNKPIYDVFICVKISNKTKENPDLDGYTKDSKIADSIFDELTRRGLKVFYSEKCCQGIEYDSQILSALIRSKKLLIISTNKQYLESAWVESEWRRWLSFIEWGEKTSDSMLLYLPSYNGEFSLPLILSKKKIQYFTQSIDVCNRLVESFIQKPNIANSLQKRPSDKGKRVNLSQEEMEKQYLEHFNEYEKIRLGKLGPVSLPTLISFFDKYYDYSDCEELANECRLEYIKDIHDSSNLRRAQQYLAQLEDTKYYLEAKETFYRHAKERRKEDFVRDKVLPSFKEINTIKDLIAALDEFQECSTSFIPLFDFDEAILKDLQSESFNLINKKAQHFIKTTKDKFYLEKLLNALYPYLDEPLGLKDPQKLIKSIKSKIKAKKALKIALLTLIPTAIVCAIGVPVISKLVKNAEIKELKSKANVEVKILSKVNLENQFNYQFELNFDIKNTSSLMVTRLVGINKIYNANGKLLSSGTLDLKENFEPDKFQRWTVTLTASDDNTGEEIWNTSFRHLKFTFQLATLYFEGDNNAWNYNYDPVVIHEIKD